MPAARSPRWTQSEIAVLEEFYPQHGVDCVEFLPGRSWHSVHQKAHKLGLKCEKITPAPDGKLEGDALEEAIRLREQENWSFARIGARFGISEASACNCMLIALCPRKGHRPAERDAHGRLLPVGIERLRLALKMGLKGCDIQLRLGLSAARVSLERRRYNADLKSRGKALLPPPGKGAAYSGVKLTKAKKLEVEAAFLEGLGTYKVSARTGASKTSCTRIRNRLIARLAREGQALPGCDAAGARHVQAESTKFITPEQERLLRERLLDRVPVMRAARDLVIGQSSAYRIRDALRRELAADGRELSNPILSGRRSSAPISRHWPPRGPKQIYAFRGLLAAMPFDDARSRWIAERKDAVAAEAERPRSFEETLARIERGEIGITANTARRHLEPQLRSIA